MTCDSQIQEFQQYILHLEQRIARYRKTGRDPARLLENKAAALQTLDHLKQAQRGKGKVCRR